MSTLFDKIWAAHEVAPGLLYIDLHLVIDGAEHALAAGDCVTFDADLPHHFENRREEEAVLLAIVSAGLRRS